MEIRRLKPSSLSIIRQGSDDRSAWADVAILGTQLTATPEVAERLLLKHPSLALHACKSSLPIPHQAFIPEDSHVDPATFGLLPNAQEDKGLFGEHLPGALLPHALEHLAIDLLVVRFPDETFAGNTCWLEREEQIMRVRISLPKEAGPAPVSQALLDAAALLNEMLI